MNTPTTNSVHAQQPETAPVGGKPKRRAPKSPAEQLAEIEAKAAALREKVEAQRQKNRDNFVTDLLKHLQIKPIDGDLDESRRLAKLRKALEI